MSEATQTDLEDFTSAGSARSRQDVEVGGIDTGRLRSIIDRAEAIQERVKEEQDALKELFVEAKSSGWNVQAIKDLLKERAARVKNSEKVDERQFHLDLYRRAVEG